MIGVQNGKQATDLLVDGASFNQIFNHKIPKRMHKQEEEEEVKVPQVAARDGQLRDDGKEGNDFPFESEAGRSKKDLNQVNYDFEEIFK